MVIKKKALSLHVYLKNVVIEEKEGDEKVFIIVSQRIIVKLIF